MCNYYFNKVNYPRTKQVKQFYLTIKLFETREPARNTRRAGHCRFVNKAPQPLNTKRGCYGQAFSGSHGGSQKIPAVASQFGDVMESRDASNYALFPQKCVIGYIAM